VLPLLSVLTAAAVGGPAADPPLSADALMRHVEFLAAPARRGRAPGSEEEAEAARYVADELARVGLEPKTQKVPLDGIDASANVHALLAGRDAAHVIVVGAHIDHLGPGFPGAEDNASGVAAVLEVARALRERRGELGRSVMFVLFGAEERGMIGSRYFVEHPPLPLANVAAMVNIDMLGRRMVDQSALAIPRIMFGLASRQPVGLVGLRDRPGLRALVDAACAPAGVVAVAPEDLPGPVDVEVSRQSAGRGDSVPFENAGIPGLFFGSGESDDYHKPTDVIARLDADILRRRAQAILGVVLALSNAPPETFAQATKPAPSPHAWTVPVGLGSGWSVHRQASDSAYLGLEMSVVRTETRTLFWIGGYADLVRDFANGTTRMTVGPEVGLGPIGLDGGYLTEVDLTGYRHAPAGYRQGFAARLIASASLLSITGRVGHFVGGSGETFGEVGLLLKISQFGRWTTATR
jgi:hypothetical protein